MKSGENSTAVIPRHGFATSATRALELLGACPAYRKTPLLIAEELARKNRVSKIWIKDETHRMGLGSFKALGGAFAVAVMIQEAAGEEDLESDACRSKAGEMTFITASAGNHGLSVAAGARIFGAHAVIVLSAGVPAAFEQRIRATGAQTIRIDGSYDDSVTFAREKAESEGWLLLADGSWEGYVERPALVMEGYSVIAEECRLEFADSGDWPTHVFLQAGVGGLAAAVAAHIRSYWDAQPRIIVVEPDAAPCLAASVRAGRLTRADGPQSNMGRLDCKEASLIAFKSLLYTADRFMTVTDEQALAATDALRAAGVATTPSGAAGLAAMMAADLPSTSQCLLFATEGPESAEG